MIRFGGLPDFPLVPHTSCVNTCAHSINDNVKFLSKLSGFPSFRSVQNTFDRTRALFSSFPSDWSLTAFTPSEKITKHKPSLFVVTIGGESDASYLSRAHSCGVVSEKGSVLASFYPARFTFSVSSTDINTRLTLHVLSFNSVDYLDSLRATDAWKPIRAPLCREPPGTCTRRLSPCICTWNRKRTAHRQNTFLRHSVRLRITYFSSRHLNEYISQINS